MTVSAFKLPAKAENCFVEYPGCAWGSVIQMQVVMSVIESTFTSKIKTK